MKYMTRLIGPWYHSADNGHYIVRVIIERESIPFKMMVRIILIEYLLNFSILSEVDTKNCSFIGANFLRYRVE